MTIKLKYLPYATILRLTKLAREARDYKDARTPKEEREGFLVIDASSLADKRIPTRAEEWGPRWAEMLGIVEKLSNEERAELAALMWFGRDPHDFASWRRQAFEHREDPHRALYICAKGPLSRYLERALIEVEH